MSGGGYVNGLGHVNHSGVDPRLNLIAADRAVQQFARLIEERKPEIDYAWAEDALAKLMENADKAQALYLNSIRKGN